MAKKKKVQKLTPKSLGLIAAATFSILFFLATTTNIFHTKVKGYNNTFYVSKNGANGDGRTWANAWNELSSINWSVVQPGDRILIDGGSTPCPSAYDFSNHSTSRPGLNCGMIYTTALNVGKSGAVGLPINIELAQDSGRNGTVVIFGGRPTPLPYCKQTGYSATGNARAAGISLGNNNLVTIDGIKRSGIMIYGAQMGIDMASSNTSYITLRNLEIFDNGTFSGSSSVTDNPGVGIAGHDLTFDRLLIHDNGQDEIQDQATSGDSHPAMSNISLTNSWLYNRRENPTATGWPFNSATGEACTHVDGVQIWAGGKDQQKFTVENTVFGPLLGQGFYPGDANTTGFDAVTIKNSLFINARAQNINSDSGNNTSGWTIQNVTSYESDSNAGGIDLSGSGHTMTNSIFYGGYASTQGTTGSGNIYFNTDSLPGSSNTNPSFTSSLPSTTNPTYTQLASLNFKPNCSSCSGKGSSISSISELLAQIDSLNSSQTPTSTSIPTATTKPTNSPTSTVVPTSTRTPSNTPTTLPTSIPTSVPTNMPTSTIRPTNTSVPTSIPTIRPSSTIRPTISISPVPTITLTPTPTPKQYRPWWYRWWYSWRNWRHR